MAEGRGVNPLTPFLESQGGVVLDGGLATTLEAVGWDLNDPLWSARMLLEFPAAIEEAHQDFLLAGADCITTASYQASFEGFARRGILVDEARELLTRSTELAKRARDRFWSGGQVQRGRLRPLVAASIGPWGAYRADGSEYTGRYGISRAELRRFHTERWQTLVRSGPDIMACETIPSRDEVEVLLELAASDPECWTWVSLSCSDAERLADGTPVEEAAAACDSVSGVVAVGVNCVSPDLVLPLLNRLRSGTTKPLLVYPNSGERYRPVDRSWSNRSSEIEWDRAATEWWSAGASAVGGCCRVGPAAIERVRLSLPGGHAPGRGGTHGQ